MTITLGGTEVVVDPPLVPTITMPAPAPVDVVVVPVVGPPGPAGSRGGFAYVQLAPASTWTIHHQLGTYPLVTILLDAEPLRPVFTDVQYPDSDTAVLTFPSPVSGRAYL